jgi:hypothetical protein
MNRSDLQESGFNARPTFPDVDDVSRRQLEHRRRHLVRRDVVRGDGRRRRLATRAPLLTSAAPAPRIGIKFLRKIISKRLKKKNWNKNCFLSFKKSACY